MRRVDDLVELVIAVFAVLRIFVLGHFVPIVKLLVAAPLMMDDPEPLVMVLVLREAVLVMKLLRVALIFITFKFLVFKDFIINYCWCWF